MHVNMGVVETAGGRQAGALLRVPSVYVGVGVPSVYVGVGVGVPSHPHTTTPNTMLCCTRPDVVRLVSAVVRNAVPHRNVLC